MDSRSDPPYALPPIDLAREPDFALGTSKVSPSTREVLRGTERELLEPRLMQVLVALFQANGRVVSRDELIARCWEGRIVGEDAINRAIWRLRRLSEVEGEASFQLETIPRVGYRLLHAGSPPASIENPAPPTLKTAAPAHQNAVMRHRLVVAAAVAIIVAATTTWLLWPERKWTVENSRPFLTSLALEMDPAFSPDGATLAYSYGPSSSRQIYIRNLAAGDGIRVSNDGFNDFAPAWSSDGGHLAFVGGKLGEPCHLMVATVPAGAAREAGRCRHVRTTFITWQSGTNYLYYFDYNDLTEGSIFRLDLDSGAKVPVVVIPRMNQVIVIPRCSPDGRWLAYLLADVIVIHDLASGRERKLAPFDLRGAAAVTQLAWTPDSRTILASISRGTGSRISAFPIDGGASYTVYTTAMRLGSFAAGKDALATTTLVGQVNFARPVSTPEAPLDVVETASRASLSPSFAPDGTLAFVSDRSGTSALWIQKPGGAATQLFDGGSARLFPVQFSPDGSRLAVVTENKDTIIVKIMTPDGANLKSFPVPWPGFQTWTPDGKAILVFDSHDRRTWRIDVNDPDKRSPFAPPHWQNIAVRPEGTFAIRADKSGIWRIDGAAPSLVTGKYPIGYPPPLAFRGGDVLVPDFTASIPRLLAQPLSGGADRMLGYMPGGIGGGITPTALAVNPKTGDILYTANVSFDANIDLLTLVRR